MSQGIDHKTMAMAASGYVYGSDRGPGIIDSNLISMKELAEQETAGSSIHFGTTQHPAEDYYYFHAGKTIS